MKKYIILTSVLLSSARITFNDNNSNYYYLPNRVNVKVDSKISLSESIESAKKFFSYKSTANEIKAFQKNIETLEQRKNSNIFKTLRTSFNAFSAAWLTSIIVSNCYIIKMIFDESYHPEGELFACWIISGISFFAFMINEAIKKNVLYENINDRSYQVAKKGWCNNYTDSVIAELKESAKEEPDSEWAKNFNLYLDCIKNCSKKLKLGCGFNSKISDSLVEILERTNTVYA